MIDLRASYNLVWDSELQPIGEGTGEKEPFDTWWERNAVRLGSLHPRIAEQWIHRHWQNSPFCHLDLNRISWRLERWSTPRLLAEVVRPDPADETNLAYDYYKLYRDRDREPAPTMRATGTWNIPTVIIEAPHGALRPTGYDSRRFFLIEGHQRMRCLAAFDRYAGCASEHETFILRYPDMA
jgi:hypothetical protein